MKPDVDTLSTVPDDPPAAGPDRALDGPPPELLLAVGELLATAELLAVAELLAAGEALLEEQPATAMAATPATMDMVSLREDIY